MLELADVVAVNKADGPHTLEARRAALELSGAMRLIGQPEDGWVAPVVTCSAQTGDGLAEVWKLVQSHQSALNATGDLQRRRREQHVAWMWSLVRDQLMDRLRDNPGVRALVPVLESDVREGRVTAVLAADQLVNVLLTGRPVKEGTTRPQHADALLAIREP